MIFCVNYKNNNILIYHIMYNQQDTIYMTQRALGSIDKQFNFSNEVYPSRDNMIKTKNMMCDGDIMLEPRLQEYIKKKKFYKQNNIDPNISLEKEFSITNKDKKILKDFLNGKKNMYLKGNKYNEPKFDGKNKSFPSKSFRDDDPRVLKVNNIKYNNNIPNRGMFYSDTFDGYYEKDMMPLDVKMDSRDFGSYDIPEKYDDREVINGLFTTDNTHDNNNGWNLNETKFNPRIDPKIDPGIEENNKFESQYRINPIVDYSKLSNKNGNSYGFTNPGTKFIKNNMNTELETLLVRGMPSNNKSKSYGYRNPDEHYYDYISDDFQHPDNVVLPFPQGGEGTRQYDKGLARNNYLYNNNRNNC